MQRSVDNREPTRGVSTSPGVLLVNSPRHRQGALGVEGWENREEDGQPLHKVRMAFSRQPTLRAPSGR